MRSIKKALLFFLSLSIFSCSKDAVALPVKKDIKILILGNSTLRHPPASNIGWYGDWGMAATSADKDFLHIYNKLLLDSHKYRSVDIKYKNIAFWESDLHYNLNQFIDITSGTYDVLIIRLGDSVTNTAEYHTALNSMINMFKTENTKVIITGIVWQNDVTEGIQEQTASKNGYKYIPFADFRSNPSNYSWGLFQNNGVAAHPSDLGMQRIGQLLYNSTIELY